MRERSSALAHNQEQHERYQATAAENAARAKRELGLQPSEAANFDWMADPVDRLALERVRDMLLEGGRCFPHPNRFRY